MKRVGFVGWRGMVGSVLMDRMRLEQDFNHFYSVFLSTSQIGKRAPNIRDNQQDLILQDAWNLDILYSLDIIVTCQGSTYSSVVYSKLRNNGWKGYWIDSASYLRMNSDSIIVLDPVNQIVIDHGVTNGIKTFVGGNCTVSLMLMVLGNLLKQNLVDWVSVATYQAASGYGARAIQELLIQMGQVYDAISESLNDPNVVILDIANRITRFSNSSSILVDCFKKPLINNVIPWIGGDTICYQGQTQEEQKGQLETNKILNISNVIPIDSLCVRVCTLRCHSQALMLKLKKDICLKEIKDIIRLDNPWVEIIENDSVSSLNKLTPIAVSGSLKIPIGRLRKMNMGDKFISAFTVGDQLLWGAAEPLRRMLMQLLYN